MESTADKKPVDLASPDKNIALLLEGTTVRESGAFGAVSYRIPTLTFLNGEALGKELPLIQPQLVLGRGEDADITIMEPSVSRRHIELTCRKLLGKGALPGLRVVLRDLESKNGTFVNYRRIRRTLLRPGDKIALGRVILRFDFRDVADQEFFDELYRLATTDHETGLLNKATILRSLNEELVHLRRYRRRLSIVLIDLDDFKSLNDTYGHLAGDRVLQATAGIIRRNLRRQDKAGRFGGEEFLIVVPETGLLGTKALAERIRRDLEQSLSCEVPLERVITASMGVAASPMDGSDAEPLLERADAALYRAKARGKNRVECSRRRARAGTGTAG